MVKFDLIFQQGFFHKQGKVFAILPKCKFFGDQLARIESFGFESSNQLIFKQQV